ncbi:hypothetical protein APSETT444_003470 [Aspergillus pseudonomiae]
MADNKVYWNHYAPFYAHWTYQRSSDGVTGKWFRFLVTAASREDAKTFFRGVERYSKTKDANIVSVKAVNLAWWTYDISGGSGWNIMSLVQNIDQMNASAYGDIDELRDSRGKILVSILNDAEGVALILGLVVEAPAVELSDEML